MEPMEPKSPLLSALTRQRKAKGLDKAENIAKSFSITEKALFLLCLAIFGGAVLSLLGKISDNFSVNVPRHGGSLSEGVVGTPRFVNPLLAVSDADRDLTQLVYSGLLKAHPDGSITPDLAESYTVSADGLTYSFVIRADATFHDGTKVTADDVEFTVEKAQDPALKSPRFVNWQGVTVEKTGTLGVVFHLKQAYAPFINNLTLGILPSHLWKNLTAEQMPFSSLNTNAIGSGPYEIDTVIKSSDGIPTQFNLQANPEYALGEPYITDLIIKSYPNDQALLAAVEAQAVNSASNLSAVSAQALESGAYAANVVSSPLTRVFGVFFNQNQNEVLAHKEVRKALDLVVDRNILISTILQGYGTVADGPLPSEQVHDAAITASSTASTTAAKIRMAASALAKAGWKKNPSTGIYELKGKTKGTASTTLALSLSTANIPELVMAAKKIEESWKSFGVKVDVRVFEPSDLNQSVIRPRKYDALLFGLVTGRNGDLYPFWHSSQRNDPGLNVALYTNQKADKLLEKMRVATSSAAVASEYKQLQAELSNDTPAIFLWSPDFIYAIPAKLHGVTLGEITTSSDRFLGIEKWYVDTDHVWNIFATDKDKIIKNPESLEN